MEKTTADFLLPPLHDPTGQHQLAESIKRNFPSYLDVPHLPLKIRKICEILATGDPFSVDASLESASLAITQSEVEHVLKLSYSFPSSAAVFFRWAGGMIGHDHSSYSWNLMVDLLGKNNLFEPMWDAINSMKLKRIVSISTFATVFSSYVAAGRIQDAFEAFEVIERYGCSRDVVALNSLVSAICRDGETRDACDFVRAYRYKIKPDADTYAILLEGWEKEGDVVNARQSFGEMVSEIGWANDNVFAYDAFLCTVLTSPDGLCEAMKVLKLLFEKSCHPGGKFFAMALEECLKRKDVECAERLWVTMTRLEVHPDADMYHTMIRIHCDAENSEEAKLMFEKFVSSGGHPGRQICSVLFASLTSGKRLNEASEVFSFMEKNGWIPEQACCDAAVRVSIDCNNAYFACMVWRSMIANYTANLEATGNFLLVRLCDFRMADEAAKFAEEMAKKGVKVSSSTHLKLKQSLLLQ